ncbi:2-isopropylmalate synthase [Marinobacter maroccanus]|uniref:2-isopropylmalate synthase n=1 Tax=Marinobacter maroccanus TaxID=2055143 RepID=A0A2S5Z5W1_9GAMM|nr:2-isopropylmalate synthase [Marinobacter maroccanus]PPI82654.1 2-isopropylmalate synthase [Marinobacter maroccanus]
MIGSEAERQFYLGAAGIRMWYARHPLPGSAPSPEFEFPEATDAPDTTPGISESVPPPVRESGRAAPGKPAVRDRTEGVARIADLQALMDSEAVAPGTTSRLSPESPSVSDTVTDSPTPEPREAMVGRSSTIPSERMNLMIWAGNGVALIGAMTADASSRLQETLAINILKSLGEDQPRVLGHVAWPIFNNLLVPGNSGNDFAEVMRSVLSGLERQQVIILQGGEDSEQSWLVEGLGRDATVRFPHTLAEIAGNPTLKRSLWQQIRPLVAR